MSRSDLRQCPYCHQDWPAGSLDHDLRGFRWLRTLPRNISVSNGDLLLHDASRGDRYLLLETKMPWEPALQIGQRWLLTSLAQQPNWTVRLLHGRLHNLRVRRVVGMSVEEEGYHTEPDLFRGSVVSWLDGGPWSDPTPEPYAPPGQMKHTHGWARKEGVWTCVGDYYAAGWEGQAATACGETWEPPA